MANAEVGVGLPAEKGLRFIIECILDDSAGCQWGAARRLGNNVGGLLEVTVPDPQNQIRITKVGGFPRGESTRSASKRLERPAIMRQGDELFLGFNDTGREPVRGDLVRTIRGSTGPMLLVRISPPIMGQQFGLGGQDIDLVILAPRLEGDTVSPITRWPTDVYVLLPLVNMDNREEIGNDEFRLIMWAEICRTMEEAEAESRAGRWPR